jgi:hypothetical protein
VEPTQPAYLTLVASKFATSRQPCLYSRPDWCRRRPTATQNACARLSGLAAIWARKLCALTSSGLSRLDSIFCKGTDRVSRESRGFLHPLALWYSTENRGPKFMAGQSGGSAAPQAVPPELTYRGMALRGSVSADVSLPTKKARKTVLRPADRGGRCERGSVGQRLTAASPIRARV